MATLIRTWAVLLVIALMGAAAAGCDKHGRDKQEIRAAWKQYVDGLQGNDGAAAVQVVNKATLDWHGKMVKLALDAPAKDVLALPPTQMYEVALIRARMTRDQLKPMDGKAYFTHATSKGWYSEGFDGTWAVTDIQVTGDAATAVLHNPSAETDAKRARTLGTFRVGRAGRMGMVGSGVSGGYARPGQQAEDPPRFPVKWAREGGAWKFDETSLYSVYDSQLTAEAKGSQKSMRDFVMLVAQAEAAEPLTMAIWEPMKDAKKRK